MSAPTTLSTLLLLACLATVHCSPIKESQFEHRLNSLQMAGPGSLTHLNANLNKYLIRKKDSSFEEYITFKNKPPVTLTQTASGQYALECEVSGSVYPEIFWMTGQQRIDQTFPTKDGSQDRDPIERHPGQLGLTMVKSRLFLDCTNQVDQIATFKCFGKAPTGKIQADAKVIIKNQKVSLEHSYHNKHAEKYFNQNAIDSDPDNGVKPATFYPGWSTRSGCINQNYGIAPLAAPPRIYFYTLTTLENIGANSVIHCSASGSPKPVVTWFDTNNEPIVPDLRKYEILKSGDLRIRNVTFDDMGKYKCMAENRYGRDMVDKIFFYPTDPNPTELERK